MQASAVLGSIEIIVPQNLAVRSEGTFLRECSTHAARADPDLPVLHAQGRSLLGSIEVRAELPESRKLRGQLTPKPRGY